MLVIPKNVRFLLLACALLFTFASCDKEFMQDQITPEFAGEEELPELLIEALPPSLDGESDPQASGRRTCFDFVFPVALVLRSDTTITVNDVEELRAVVARIRNSRIRANFVYPFDVELANGDVVTIERFATLRRLHRACRGLDEEPASPCITINYPIEVIAGDSTFTVNDRLELARANRAFRPRGVSIVYPITVTFTENGNEVTINGDRELARLRAFCNNRGETDDRGTFCYRIIYPVDLTVNGRPRTVVSRAAWRLLVRAANRNAEIEIVYPISLIHRESEEIVVVEDRAALDTLREQCVE